jgi:hypothetical protein
MESDRRSSEAAAIGQRETCTSAMEIEFRALLPSPTPRQAIRRMF